MNRLFSLLLVAASLLVACGAAPTPTPEPTLIPVTPIPDGLVIPLEARFVREDDFDLGIDILTLDYPANWVWNAPRLAFANTEQALNNLLRSPGFYEPRPGEAIAEVLPLNFQTLADDYDLGEDASPDELLETVIERFSREEALPEFSAIETFEVRAGEAALIRYTIRGTTVITIAITGWNGYALLSLSAPVNESAQYVPTLRAIADTLDLVVIEP